MHAKLFLDTSMSERGYSRSKTCQMTLAYDSQISYKYD